MNLAFLHALRRPLRHNSALFFALGLVIVAAYWYSVHPLGFGRSYLEDWCLPDLGRQLMSEALTTQGRLSFSTDKFFAPYGTDLPYGPWSLEMTWLGAYFWSWNREFPFLWVHFGASLLISYCGVGFVLRKMKLSPAWAWGLATLALVFHIPRHFKTWHHYEHQLQHWLYLSLFLEAWIWQRFWREKRWSWSLEGWRGLCLVGMMTTCGYFWGPLILLWALARVLGLGLALRLRKLGTPIRVEGAWRHAAPAVALMLIFAAIDFAWYLPLAAEMRKAGPLEPQFAWFVNGLKFFSPLWLDAVMSRFREQFGLSPWAGSVLNPETVVTVGWLYWIPALLGLYSVRVRLGGRAALWVALPFVLLFLVAFDYASHNPPFFALAIRKVVPFMGFFRVASRWGLLLPQVMLIITVLCLPELQAWAADFRRRKPRAAIVWMALFVLSSVGEASLLRIPVTSMPPLDSSTATLLADVKASPGTTVLDLPFCTTGGNGVCNWQCPNNPASIVGQCFRAWHDKKVYGLYAPRLVSAQCELYGRAPYLSWFDAWRDQRCFNEGEWRQFCSYLDERADLSAILLYPDIWVGASAPSCLADFERHLGKPVAQSVFALNGVRGEDEAPRVSRLLRYGVRCVK